MYRDGKKRDRECGEKSAHTDTHTKFILNNWFVCSCINSHRWIKKFSLISILFSHHFCMLDCVRFAGLSIFPSSSDGVRWMVHRNRHWRYFHNSKTSEIKTHLECRFCHTLRIILQTFRSLGFYLSSPPYQSVQRQIKWEKIAAEVNFLLAQTFWYWTHSVTQS